MLVEILTGAEPQAEPTVGHHGHRRGGLGHHSRVITDGGTGHRRHEADALRAVGHRPEDAPREGAVALRLEPGVEVIGHDGEVEPRLLGQLRLADEIVRGSLLGHERVTERRHE